MQTNYNTCFETLVTVNNWQLSQQSCYLLITHQSHDHSDHLEKDLCNIPPIPLKLPLFGPPPPPSPQNFCRHARGAGVWIFSGNTHYTYEREEKELKFCRQSNLLRRQKLYKIQMQISGCLPSGRSLATDSVHWSSFIVCKDYFSRITFMLYIFVFL